MTEHRRLMQLSHMQALGAAAGQPQACYALAVRILLRLVAVLAGVSVVATVIFILQFGWTGIEALLATGTFGIITIAGWLLTLIAGSLAAAQLFLLRPLGRIAAVVLFGSMLLYYIVGLFAFREPRAPVAPIITLCVALAVLLLIVLSPPAKRICKSRP